jgi:ABC-2 type transport system ATP-binding protein
VLGRLGYCPEIDNFYEEMTGREFVTQLAALSGLRGANPEGAGRRRDRAGRHGGPVRPQARGLFQGMRQRIKVAQGIVHDPEVLVLDEPLNGLDPVGRREMSELMAGFAREAGACSCPATSCTRSSS